MSGWNDSIIAEFRANAGVVCGPFAGVPLLLLHTTGARTGHGRVNPVVYQAAGDRYVVFASNNGNPTDPDWFRNLLATPETTVEVGSDVVAVRARVVDGAERRRLWDRQVASAPAFAGYEASAGRPIPVVVLEPR